jgi:hypothetical protein
MIAFDLECSLGHCFEGWFHNMESFEEQKTKKLVNCPVCNDTEVRRVLSPVALKTSSQKNDVDNVGPIDYQKLAKEVVEYVNKNFEDVGSDFAKEALKMHYIATEKRNIRGSATKDEEKMLRDEGIEFFKLPIMKFEDDKKN